MNTATTSMQREGTKVRIHISKTIPEDDFLCARECEYSPTCMHAKMNSSRCFPACIGFVLFKAHYFHTDLALVCKKGPKLGEINLPKRFCRFRLDTDINRDRRSSHACSHRYFTLNVTFAFAFGIQTVIDSDAILFYFT